MWYLITVEPHDFLELSVNQDEIKINYQEQSDGIAEFKVNNLERYFHIQVYVDSYEPYYLNEIYKICPTGFTCINHATVLLHWKDEEERLNSILNTIIHPKDKFCVFKIAEVILSNFLPKEFLKKK
jgi:hypothetical protein